MMKGVVHEAEWRCVRACGFTRVKTAPSVVSYFWDTLIRRKLYDPRMKDPGKEKNLQFGLRGLTRSLFTKRLFRKSVCSLSQKRLTHQVCCSSWDLSTMALQSYPKSCWDFIRLTKNQLWGWGWGWISKGRAMKLQESEGNL